MPRRLGPLPPELSKDAFTVGEGLKAKVTQSRLDAPDLARPAWGLRCRSRARTIDEHARQVSTVLPATCAFSHLTAARLWRLPLPSDWRLGEPLHVMTDGTPLRRAGVVGHRGLASRDIEELRGHLVTSPVPTWVDLAGIETMAVEDLVIAGDAFAARAPDLLAEMVAAGTGKGGRGRRKLREAAALLRAGSGSPMETRARLGFARGGLPEPELNADVFDEGGQWLARVDFLWRAAKVIVEYEGDQHRTDRRQWQIDIERTRRLEALGWRVIRVTALDLTDHRRHRELIEQLSLAVGA